MNKSNNKKYSIKNEKDRVYLNVILQNESLFSPTEIPVFAAEVNYQLNDPIIDNCEDYYLAAESYTIPISNVPVWIPDIKPYAPPYFNTNINETLYSFTMTYNGISSGETFIQFISQNPNKFVQPLGPSQIFQDRNTTYYDVYTYTQFVYILNQGLIQTFNNLNANIPLPTTDIPYFIYDEENIIFCLIANKNFYNTFGPNPITIYCNYYLFEYIYSLPNNYLPTNNPSGNGQDFLLYVIDQGNNTINPSNKPSNFPLPGDYFIMKQNIPTIAALSPMKSLFISSLMIPVNPQISPLKPTQEKVNPGIVNKLKLVADIEPLLFSKIVANRSFIEYRSAKYSLIDLCSAGPLYNVDFSIYWRDRFGNPHLLYLNNTQPANITVVFIKKDSVHSIYNDKI